MTESALPVVETAPPAESPVRRACDTLGMPYARMDAKGAVTGFNPQALRMMGAPAEPIPAEATSLQKLTKGPDLPRDMADHLRKLTPDKPKGTIRITGADGRIYQVNVTAQYDEAGQPAGYESTATDITETAQPLLDRAAKAKEKEELATETALTVAHDVRSPLTSIRGYAQMLRTMDNVPRESAVEWLATIEQNAGNAYELAQQYLDYMRASQETAVTQPVDMQLVMQNIRMGLAPLRKTKEFSAELPVYCPSVQARSEIVEMALMNFVTNAVKYGGAKPSLEVRAMLIEEGKRARYEVHDDGIALSEADRKRLFQKFTRLQRASEGSAKGIGLGLASVKLNIERCGGEVGVESEEGKGNTFYFILPAAETTPVATPMV